MSTNERFTDSGSGGDGGDSGGSDAPTGAERAVEQTPDDQVTQEEVDQVFEDLRDDTGGSTSTDTGAAGAVQRTPEPDPVPTPEPTPEPDPAPDTQTGNTGGGGTSTTTETTSPPADDGVTRAERQDITATFQEETQGTNRDVQGVESGEGLTQEEQIASSVAAVNEDYRTGEFRRNFDRETQVRAAALGFERQIVTENESVGSRDDVAIDRQGDMLGADLTALGRERAGVNPSVGDVREQVAAETPGVEAGDVTVDRTDDGGFDVGLTDAAIEERTRVTNDPFDVTSQGAATTGIGGDPFNVGVGDLPPAFGAAGATVGDTVGGFFDGPPTLTEDERRRDRTLGETEAAQRAQRRERDLEDATPGPTASAGRITTQDLETLGFPMRTQPGEVLAQGAIDTGEGIVSTAEDVGGAAGRLPGDVAQSVQRGGAASEAAREGLNLAIDIGTQGELNREISRASGLEGERVSEDEVAISGPAINPFQQEVLQEGEQGNIDTDITESLTEGPGLFRETGDASGFFTETEESLRETADQRRDFFGFGEEARDVTPDAQIVGGLTTRDVAEDVGQFPGEVAALGPNALLAADFATEVGSNTPRTVDEFGAGETAETAANVGGVVAGQAAEEIEENPAEFASEVVVGAAGGTLVGGLLERGTTRARLEAEGFRGPDIDAEDTTRQPETLETGDQPTFETDTGAPGFEAASEFRQRASETPEELQEAAGSEQVLFRSESDRLPDDVEAGEGSFELPGLFASSDFPPLRTESGGGGLSRPSLRLPRLFDEPDRSSAFEAPDIEAAPETATGSGFAVRGPDGEIVDTFPDTGTGAQAARRRAEEVGGERVPDPGTRGAQFLSGEAERGTAFVRPSGSRTPELEGIFPPETRFERTTTGTINIGGQRGTLDVFRRADDQPDAPGRDRTGDPGDGTVTASELSRRQSRSTPEGEPVTPLPTFGGSSTGTSTPSDPFGGSATGTPTGGPSDVTAPPSSPPFGSPTGATSTSGTPGLSDPTGPPSSPPSTTTTVTTGSPPTSPPSTGPPSITTSTGTPPTSTPGTPTGGGGGGIPGIPPGGGPGGGGGGGGLPGSGSPDRARPRTGDRDTDSDDEPGGLLAPTGQEFRNPVASGAEILFGAADGASGQTGFADPEQDSDVADVFGFGTGGR